MRYSFTKSWTVVLTVLALAFSAIGVAPAYAATFTVTNLNNSGPGSLRQAITDANAAAGADTITFGVNGTIKLASTLPHIAGAAALTIDGTGKTVTISGNHLVRVVWVNAGASLTVKNLTIANGKDTTSVGGGGIYNLGKLTIIHSSLTGNSAVYGGGIYTDAGTLSTTLTTTTFSGNSATDGGGIYIYSGSASIANSTFSGNSANNYGGGIYSGGTLMTVSNSVFSNNHASYGGAIGNGSNLNITNSTFSGNSATKGGAVETGGIDNVNITKSSFSHNSAQYGGGIYKFDGMLNITASPFSNNTASSDGGGLYNNNGAASLTRSTFSGNTASGAGGGVFNSSVTTLTILGSRFSNSAAAGGGIYNAGVLTIANSTLSANTASNNGGAIDNALGQVTVVNSTFRANNAGGSGGVVDNSFGTVTFSNSIVVQGSAGANCADTAVGNGGNNIDDGTSCGWGSASGSMSNTNPLLGSMTGSPGYFPLNPGSPARDAGNDAVCAAAPVSNTSQNGKIRPQGTHCDIGSVEASVISTVSIFSIAAQDGWVLESSATSGLGGTLNATSTSIRLGDDATRKQYRGILSFNTGAVLPDKAVIMDATLWLTKSAAVTGPGDPLTLFQGFMVDIKNGPLGTAALQAGDFQAAAGKTYGPFTPPLLSSILYEIDLTGAQAYINRLATNGGLTQIRLRFKLGHNNNAVANYLSLASGSAAGNKPELVITYYVP